MRTREGKRGGKMEGRGRLERKRGREEGEGKDSKEGKRREIEEGGRGGNYEGEKGEIISHGHRVKQYLNQPQIQFFFDKGHPKRC